MQHSHNPLLQDVIQISPKVFHDARGYFYEGYQENRYHALGIKEHFVQDNLSYSVKGSLRGMHYQLRHPQGKLVGVTQGSVFDVVVDIRHGSPTFGRWQGFELSAENAQQLYIPPGFAHGFYVLSESAHFYYKCTHYYVPEDDHGIAWNDPLINIAWPLLTDPILSTKDHQYPCLNDVKPDCLPPYREKEHV